MVQEKEERNNANQVAGRVVDIEFDLMIQKKRKGMKPALPHISSEKTSICICVRKRPLFQKEMKQGEIDSISCANPYITIHEPKVKVDGITKYIQDHQFIFDNTFSHQEESHDIYQH